MQRIIFNNNSCFVVTTPQKRLPQLVEAVCNWAGYFQDQHDWSRERPDCEPNFNQRGRQVAPFKQGHNRWGCGSKTLYQCINHWLDSAGRLSSKLLTSKKCFVQTNKGGATGEVRRKKCCLARKRSQTDGRTKHGRTKHSRTKHGRTRQRERVSDRRTRHSLESRAEHLIWIIFFNIFITINSDYGTQIQLCLTSSNMKQIAWKREEMAVKENPKWRKPRPCGASPQ